MDGREFIKQAVKDLNQTSTKNEWKTFDHFVMNLPAIAIEFLGNELIISFYSYLEIY